MKDILPINLELAKAKDNVVEGTLALQGGAFRGIYTSGVLDALMENDINLSDCIGISAGALNAINYISGDIRRSAKINIEHRHNPKWIGYKAILPEKGIVGFSFVFNELTKEIPFDFDRFYRDDRTFYAQVTNLETGENEYFTNHQKNLIFKAAKASASMPYISMPVEINGKPYLDGGCNDQLGIRFAQGLGKKILFVATRDKAYREKEDNTNMAVQQIYRKYPKFVEALSNSNKLYNQDMNLVEELIKENKLFRIAPSKPINIKRFEGDMGKLLDVYILGYNDAKKLIPEIKKFFNMDDERLVKGGIYHHFKDKYYVVEDIAYDSETKEEYVVYRRLYDDKSLWIRKKSMFLSEVDKEKYPDVQQKYRFELVEDENYKKIIKKKD